MSAIHSENKLQTAWFTFGQVHVHNVNGIIFDKDCVVEITSPNPRETMFETFGRKWAMQYDEMPDVGYYQRGIIKL